MKTGLLSNISVEELARIDPISGLPSSDTPIVDETIIDNIKDIPAIAPIEPLTDPKKITIKTGALIDPGASLEKEYNFYGQVKDISIFANLDYEDHEQWVIKVDKNTNNLAAAQIRVRKTTPYVNKIAGKPFYTFCVKRKEYVNEADALTINNEYEKKVDVDCFELIKSASDKGMIKRRFKMPIPHTNSCYEIDLYFNAEGEEFSEWCRVEVEVDSAVMTVRPPMPPGIDEVTQKDRISWLFDNIFNATHHSVIVQQ